MHESHRGDKGGILQRILIWLLPIALSVAWGATASFGEDVELKEAKTRGSKGVSVTDSHQGKFSVYEGTKTCLQCHESEAIDMHSSVHYQWKGDTRDVVDPNTQTAGKYGSINEFCIFPDINWIGKLVNVDGVQVDGGCAKCHVGMGAKPDPTASRSQLENIDCLICHSQEYKRKVELVDGAYKFVPDTSSMSVSILQAASNISLPSKDTCLNCHTGAGGGNNYKRGDIEETHRKPSRDFDVHMASRADGGAGLECLNCHTAVAHRIAGRGSDLKPRDSYDVVACTNCHDTKPHENTKLDKHTARVNCTVCHIPTFARSTPTDMERNWSLPGEIDQSKRLYDPHMIKETNVLPEYRFFNGKSFFYNFGETAAPGESGRVVMSAPEGDILTPGAKIYAFKHHLGTQPIDPVTDKLLPLKIGIFFQEGDLATAVQEGVKGVGWSYNGYEFAETERYMGIFHEVAPAERALSCNSCHGGSRLDFEALGYKPNGTYNGKPLCSSCHGSKTGDFYKIHEKHVTDKRLDCIKCHVFSKAG